jgi:hypothetical protein
VQKTFIRRCSKIGFSDDLMLSITQENNLAETDSMNLVARMRGSALVCPRA